MEPAISVVKRVVERAKPKAASKSGLHYADVKKSSRRWTD